jgi:hypothetical protein
MMDLDLLDTVYCKVHEGLCKFRKEYASDAREHQTGNQSAIWRWCMVGGLSYLPQPR